MSKKQLLLKFYKVINVLPFNNRKRGKARIINHGALFLNCNFISSGDNNVLEINKCCVFKNCSFYFYGSNNTIQIGEDCRGNNAEFHIEDSSNNIIVGERTVFSGKIHLACIEGTKIEIGNDCLFSSEIIFRTGDSHSILNLDGKRINKSKNIIIKNHVWIGHRVTINKGVIISDNSIVGSGAIVTRPFIENNVIIAGVPGKIIKDKVDWDSKRI